MSITDRELFYVLLALLGGLIAVNYYDPNGGNVQDPKATVHLQKEHVIVRFLDLGLSHGGQMRFA